MNTTEQGALAHASTESKCLDLFSSGFLRTSDEKSVSSSFSDAWKENAKIAMQVLMHARDCRGGKGERKCVLAAMSWLREHKPLTYQRNLERFVGVGCYRDLLELSVKADPKDKAGGEKEIVELEMMAAQLLKDEAELKEEKEEKPAEKPTGMDTDENKSESEDKKGGQKRKIASISLAAKWAPSEKGKYDKSKSLSARLAKLLFPEDPAPKKRYRKVLSKLRGHLRLVESMMSKGDWKQIQFDKVPSRASFVYKKAFRKHEGERYAKFLEDCKSGKKQIKARGMQPHELVNYFLKGHGVSNNMWSCSACTLHNPNNVHICQACNTARPANAGGGTDDAATIEAQWKSIVDELKKEGALSDCVAVADVSGSMEGVPMQVSIAMGILVAQLAAEPFRGRLITFETNPQWHKVPVESKSLQTMVQNVKAMKWGGSTRMDKVFSLLLKVATENKLPQEALPKTMFIFSDMQFSSANSGGAYRTTYGEAKAAFEREGYQLPRVVFWNLRAAKKAFPVDKDAPGVALVSGFSADLLKLFMHGDLDSLSPIHIMMKAVGKYEVEIEESEKAAGNKSVNKMNDSW